MWYASTWPRVVFLWRPQWLRHCLHQFDRSRIHLNEFCFNPVSAAYIIHFVDQLEPPATSAAAPVERHVFIVRRTVSQVFVFLVVAFIYISLFHRDFS